MSTYRLPSFEEVAIGLDTSSDIDELFVEYMSDYISESGMNDELDFDIDMYLESFSFDEKINKIINSLKAELSLYKIKPTK